MAATDDNQRVNRRITPGGDCEIVASIDNDEHEAVLTDVSSGGYGMYLTGGNVESGQSVRFIFNDTLHIGVVAHVRREQSLIHVGVRRLSDMAILVPPVPGPLRKVFQTATSGNLPVIFSLVVAIGGTWLYASGGIHAIHAWRMELRRQNMLAAAAAEARGEKPEPNPLLDYFFGSGGETETAKSSSTSNRSGGWFSGWNNADRDKVARIVGGSGTSWSDLVDQLGLSSNQQDQIRDNLGKASNSTAVVVRSKVLSVLTSEQRSRLNQLAASS